MVKTRHICLQWLCLDDRMRTFDARNFILSIYHRKCLDESTWNTTSSMSLLTLQFYQRVSPANLRNEEVFLSFVKSCFFWNRWEGMDMDWGDDWSQAQQEAEEDRQAWRERRRGREGSGWNHSFYMLSGFNLVRDITHQFTEVANQMSVLWECVLLAYAIRYAAGNLLSAWHFIHSHHQSLSSL